MTKTTKDALRTAVLTALVKRAPKSPGRTALMKFAYLLQTVRGVPLGYRFRLHNYGPYDEEVLVDAREATTAGLLKSQLVMYSSGYGYEFSVGDSANCSSKEQANRRKTHVRIHSNSRSLSRVYQIIHGGIWLSSCRIRNGDGYESLAAISQSNDADAREERVRSTKTRGGSFN